MESSDCTVCRVADAYTLTNARSRFGELVNRARFGRERIVLTEHGKPVAAIIRVEELAETPEQAAAILAPHSAILDAAAVAERAGQVR